MSDVEIRVVDDPARDVAHLLVEHAWEGAHVALSGGSTPRAALEHAAALEHNWRGTTLWWGDDRCVPPDHEHSNFRLAREALLERLTRPPRAINRIRGEFGAEAAATRYDLELRSVELGLVVLGIGADGHTASLFPDAPALDARERLAVPVRAADVERVTLTRPALASARVVVFLAFGAGKAEAVRRSFADKPTRATPASLVRSERGATVAIIDRAAAANLTK